MEATTFAALSDGAGLIRAELPAFVASDGAQRDKGQHAVTLDDFEHFRQLSSTTPGHTE